jgi:hypothetical protein
MTFEQYRAIDAVNVSSLKHMYVGKAPPTEDRLCITSPYRYDYFKRQPDTKATDAMKLGSATHTAVFEPDRLPLEYAIWTGDTRKGPKWDAFLEAAEGRTDLTEAAYHKALAIRDAVRANPLAAAYLERGEAEKTITWTDEATGLRCKSRLDFLSHSLPTVVDLKTTNDISERAFKALCERMGYFRQLAMYGAGAVACDLLVRPSAVIIAVENKAPYEVAVYRIEPDSLAGAAEEVAELLTVLKRCRETGVWPSRYTTEQTLTRPDWVTGEPEIAFEE